MGRGVVSWTIGDTAARPYLRHPLCWAAEGPCLDMGSRFSVGGEIGCSGQRPLNPARIEYAGVSEPGLGLH